MSFEITNKWCLQRAQLAWKQKNKAERIEFLKEYYLTSMRLHRRIVKRILFNDKLKNLYLRRLADKKTFDELPDEVKKEIHCFL